MPKHRPADPTTNASATIEADVQPLIVNVAGLTFDGRQVMAGRLGSPLFALNDYGSTTAATEPAQTASANVGRYTLMGDLNPFAGFRQPATGC